MVLSDAASWVVAIGGVLAFAALTVVGRRRRVGAGLSAPAGALVVVRVVAVALAAFAAVYVMNQDRGVPIAALILVGFVAVFDRVLRRTHLGRHVYAVGGNAEASRRAGIHVFRVRVVAFALCSSMAAIGGFMAASRLIAVNQSSGGSDLLLLAIAGPVIADASLFGGCGSVWSALLGALVIGSITNGMDLLGYESPTKFIVTGAVLLGAVVLDSIARLGRRQAGRVQRARTGPNLLGATGGLPPPPPGRRADTITCDGTA